MLRLVRTAGATVTKYTKSGASEHRLKHDDLIPGYRTNFRSDEVLGTICDVVYKDTMLQAIPVCYLELSSEEEAYCKGFTAGYHVIQVIGKLVTGYYMDEVPLSLDEPFPLPTEPITLDPNRVYDCQVGGHWLDNYHSVKLHGHMVVLLEKNWFVFIDPDDYPCFDSNEQWQPFAEPYVSVTNTEDVEIPF